MRSRTHEIVLDLETWFFVPRAVFFLFVVSRE